MAAKGEEPSIFEVVYTIKRKNGVQVLSQYNGNVENLLFYAATNECELGPRVMTKKTGRPQKQ